MPQIPKVWRNLPTLETLHAFRPPSDLRSMLRHLAMDEIKIMYEDATTALSTTRWAVANSGGTGVSNFAVPGTKVSGNVIQGATGTTGNGSISMIGPLAYLPSQNAGMLAIISFDVVTSLMFDVGFIDAVPGSNNGAVNNYDTPTMNATNFVGVSYNTGATTNKTLGAYQVGSGASQTAHVQVLTGLTDPIATKYYAILIQMRGATAATSDAMIEVRQLGAQAPGASGAYLKKSSVARNFDTTNGALAGATLMAPWFYCQTLNTTTHKPQLQAVYVWEDLVV